MAKKQILRSPILVKPQYGFTLIEVLVAVIILSIGLLGLAGLQATGVRNNHSSYLRSQATVLAYDIIDRMRANRPRRDEDLNDMDSYITGIGDTHTAPNCKTAKCNISNMAEFDLAQWKDSLSELLPSGDGSIAISITGVAGTNLAVTATVIVEWDDTRGDGDETTFQAVTQL